MKIVIAEPYHSHAMRRPAAAIVQTLRSLAPQVEVVLSDGPDLSASAGADVVYHLPWHTLVGLDTQERKAKHVILYTHCNPGAESDLRRACAKADMVVCMAYTGRQELIRLGVDPKKLWVIPMGVDGQGFSPRKVRVGVVGTVQPNGRKREHLLTELAWQMDGAPFQFVIIGDGWNPTAETLRNSGVAVEYHAKVGDLELASLYRSMDVLLVTGFLEGGPLPLLEALASGVPVLTPKFGYAADLHLPVSSYYDSVRELRQRLEWDYARPVRERAERVSLYTWDWWAQEHLRLFERVLGAPLPLADGVEWPRRYEHLLAEIDAYKPRVIVEVGTHRGDRAVQMVQQAARHRPIEEIEYHGFDLFEEMTPNVLEREFSKQPPGIEAVMGRLQATGAQVHLHQGDTKDTLAQFTTNADLIFVDGGHSHETIASDWRHLQRSMGPTTVTVFDDYYGPRRVPETENVGCNALIDALRADEWTVGRLLGTDHFMKPWGELAISMFKVRRRGPKRPYVLTPSEATAQIVLNTLAEPEGAPV
ncbi:MAG: class I SAM-dependent methyltransferase [Anaerolineales bacterium]|nr:class I SAM-dependent methyltransferase [Anaerolineales bacterium]